MSRRDDHPPTRTRYPVPGTRYPVPGTRYPRTGWHMSETPNPASMHRAATRAFGSRVIPGLVIGHSVFHWITQSFVVVLPEIQQAFQLSGVGVGGILAARELASGSCETAWRGGGRRPAEALGFALLRLTIRLWRRTPAACEPSRVIGGCVWIRSRSGRGRYRFRGTSDGGRTRHDASVAGTGPPVHPVHRCR